MADQDFVAEHQNISYPAQEQSGVVNYADNNNLENRGITHDLYPGDSTYPKRQLAPTNERDENRESSEIATAYVEIEPIGQLDMETLYLEASEIAGQRLTAGQQLAIAMANQMSYEDLHPLTKAKVDKVRNASSTGLDIQKIATQLLNQYRQRMRPV
ncbi:MAG: hypothetical protein AAF821_16810 [Cyanobacteria bacterium P01_D01_bin.156]